MWHISQKTSPRQASLVFLLGVVVLAACNTSPATTQIPSTAVSATVTPDLRQQNIQDFYNGLRFMNVDLSCSVPCWNQFAPQKSTASDVFAWFASIKVTRGVLGDSTIPNNTVSLGTSGEDLVVFSDNTQPEPMLRAFMVSPAIDMKTFPTGTQFDLWLPNNVLSRFGSPSELVGGDFDGDFYYILMDFPSQKVAIDYEGSDSYAPGTTNVESCPLVSRNNRIRIWVYSAREKDGLSLIQALNKYKDVEGFGISLPKFPLTTITAPDQIAAITDPLSKGGCVSLKH